MRVLLLLAMPGLILVGNSHPRSARAGAERPTMITTSPEVVDDVPTKRVIAGPPPKPAPPPPPPDNSLRVGSQGPAVLALEQHLSQLNYLVGKVDGIFDASTKFGVTAFQKVEGLPRSGKGTDQTLARIQGASTPAPKYTSPADHLEVDIPRQVAFVVRGAKVAYILPIVTGSGKAFYHPKQKRTVHAITPNGTYHIYYKKPGLHISPLGRMYYSSFFNGGIAFHGSPYMVTYPGSHGCVRIPMTFHVWFYENVSPRGMTVYVYGGPKGENPAPTIEEGPPVAGAEGSDQPAASPSPSPSPSPEPIPTQTPTVSPTHKPGD
jgi:peptidoglycan hydrolase-like protein with peptidoglycan-binding domain